MTSLSPRERKLVALLILVGLIAIIWLAILSPILSGFAARAEERTRLTDTFARNARLIGGIARLRGQAEHQKIDAARFHIVAPTPTAATETLKERLAADITAAGGDVRSVQDIADRTGWVRAWAEGRMTLPQIITLLDKVQNTPPFLVTTSLTISADRAAQSGKLDLMDVRLEAAGSHTPPQSR
jgi:hypothetical protein